MTRIQGILFDLGDTLLDFGPVDTIDLFEQGAQRTYQYLQGLGMALPPLHRYHRRQLRAIRWAYALSHITRREFNTLWMIDRFARAMGRNLTPDQLEELAWLWYEPLSEQATVEAGVAEMLQQFIDDGLTLGVVSNTFIPGPVLDRHLEREELLRYLPIRVYSCDARYRKPNPKIFRHALAAANLSAETTLFVGDSPKADVFGSRRMGMISVLKDPLGRRRPYRLRPHHTISRILDLPDVVKQYR